MSSEEVWDLTPVYKDGLRGKTVRVKGLLKVNDRTAKMLKNKNVSNVNAKKVSG